MAATRFLLTARRGPSAARSVARCRGMHLVLGGLAAIGVAVSAGTAPAATTVYGTTAASTSGATYTAGTITSGNAVRLDDGATVSGSSPIVVNGTFQYNQTTGTLTLSNTVSGTGTLSVLGTGMLKLNGTNSSGVLSLNNTTNADAGSLVIGDFATAKGIFQVGASGTGTLNVAGGAVTSGSFIAFGVGSNSRGVLNLSSGTVSSRGMLYIGGTGVSTSEGFTSGVPPAEGNATVAITGGLLQSASSSIVIASGSTSNAAVTISGGGQLGNNLGFNVLNLGITGTGTIDVNSGGVIRVGQTYIGYRAGSRGTLNVNAGGVVTAASDLFLCNGTGTSLNAPPGGSHGTLNVASGGIVQARSLAIVVTTTTGTNVVVRTGTGVATISGTYFANGFGANSQTAGLITVGGLGSGTASLTINSGGYVVASAAVSRAANGSITLNSGGTLQIGGASGGSDATVIAPIASTGTIGSGTAGSLVGDLNYAGTLKFAQNGTSTYAGVLSGAGDVIKTGTGAVTLTGSNSYTGGTTLTAGLLSLGSANALGTTGTLSFNGGAIQFTGTNTTDYSSRFSTADNQQFAIDTNGQSVTLASNLTNTTSSFLKQGSGTATLTGANSFAAITTGTTGGVLAGTAASLATSGTATTGPSSTIEMTVASGNASWAGRLVGTGTFTKLGAGTLTLTSVATGSTGGRLVISDGAVVGTTDNIRRAVTNNATLTFDQTFSGSTPSVIAGTGSLAVVGSGTVILGGNNSYSGGNTVAAGATLEGTVLSVRGAIANDGKVTFRSNTNGTYPGNMSGTGVLEKYGSGALTLTGTNTHTGGTVVGAGSIVATTDNIQGNITNNALVVFNQSTNGTYAGSITGNSSGVVRLPITTTGTVTLTGSNSYGGGTEVFGGTLVGTTTSLQGTITNDSAVIFDQATDGTYAGTMTGIGTLTKLGAGSLILSGSNGHTGTTTVAEGKLLINGLLTSSNFTNVGNLATLGGSGTISQLVTILSGGTISPGNSPGLLTVGQLDLQAGSTAIMQIIGAGSTAGTAGTDYDQLLITTPGAIRFGGTLDLGFANLQSFADGTSFDLFSYTGTPNVGNFSSVISTGTGTYGGLTFLGNAGVWTATAGSQQLTFTETTGQLLVAAAVPEPTTMALVGAAASVGLVLRRRRAT